MQNGRFSAYPVVYSPIDLYPPYYIYDTLGVSDISDTIWIESPPYYQDSARQFFMPVADSTKLWIDDHTYHNYRFGLNPRTLGVMTFDGLDAMVIPMQLITNTNYADYLTSKPINLENMMYQILCIFHSCINQRDWEMCLNLLIL